MPPTANANTRHVGISLGNLDRFVDGLGEFAQQLCTALVARSAALRAEGRLALHFHTVPSLAGCFGPEVAYLPVQRSQEFKHPAGPQPLALWHTLNQLNRYRAPAGTPQVMTTVHDLNFVHVKRGFSRWRDGWRLKRLLARNQHIVTITDFVAQDLRQHTGWRGPLHTIYNGARNFSQAPGEAIAGLAGRPFFFHLSRMAPSKNVEALLALAAAWPEAPTLVLAGPSAERNAELRAQADALGLGPRVQLLTLVSEAQKAWLYQHCTAFMFPSLTEGFGLPPIEALHCGRPVFLSDRTCLPEVGGDAAFYWRSFEPTAMRAVVEQALAHFGPPQADHARQHAARYTWEAAADAYLALYMNTAPLPRGSV